MGVIYVKRCLGKGRKPINIFKIRTMVLDAESRKDLVVQNQGLDSYGKVIDDPRITVLGRFLRKYWIDEFPQLYNLFRGDIKLVGIRPRSEESWRRYPINLMERSLNQRPGLMGIEYAFVPSNNFEEQVLHMEEYLSSWERDSFRTDREYFFRIMSGIFLKGIRST